MVYIPLKMEFLFLPLSLSYRAVCRLKNLLYDWKIYRPQRASLSVISVGNIALGGSGKTPLCTSLLSFLLAQGFKPALVTRGYKGEWEGCGGVLSDGKNILGNWRQAGDEPFLVAQAIPEAGVLVGKNRIASCERAKQLGFDLAILDDGFQHRRLHRDLDVVLFDPAEKTRLREPVSSLQRSQVILLKQSRGDRIKKKIKQRFPRARVFEYSFLTRSLFSLNEKKSESPSRFKDKKVLAFAGIARSERFLTSLESEGIKPALFLKFPDHHLYPQASLEKIKKKSAEIQAEALITTEKDALKIAGLKDFQRLPAYSLQVEVKAEPLFYAEILSFLKHKAESG